MTPPRRRTTTAVKDLANVPHSGLCAVGAPAWIPDTLSPAQAAIADRRCTCGAGFLRILAGGES